MNGIVVGLIEKGVKNIDQLVLQTRRVADGILDIRDIAAGAMQLYKKSLEPAIDLKPQKRDLPLPKAEDDGESLGDAMHAIMGTLDPELPYHPGKIVEMPDEEPVHLLDTLAKQDSRDPAKPVWCGARARPTQRRISRWSKDVTCVACLRCALNAARNSTPVYIEQSPFHTTRGSRIQDVDQYPSGHAKQPDQRWPEAIAAEKERSRRSTGDFSCGDPSGLGDE